MRVHRLALANFRNYAAAEFAPGPGPNVLLGANGAGKTNVLEALHLIATGFSYRAGRDQEMIRWGADSFSVRAEVERDAVPQDVVAFQVTYTSGLGKTVRRGGKALTGKARTAALGGAVVFSPDDLALVKGAPAGRRMYLDLLCAKTNPRARPVLRRYERVLAHRNRLLAEARTEAGPAWGELTRRREAALAPWTAQLIELGAEILEHRLAACAAVSGLARAAYAALGGAEVLSVAYQSAIFATGPAVPAAAAPDRAQAAKLLARGFAERCRDELARGVTLVGPHRDDLALNLGDNAARVFASQGQQRTIALALRLAEVAYVRRETGEEPLLLLDDVFSELDPHRRTALLALLAEAAPDRRQTYLAVTDTAGVPLPGFRQAEVFSVGGGEIRRGG